MPLVRTITLHSVNAYLIGTDSGFILIDTGFGHKRGDFERELRQAGCTPGNLQLILVTHADSDHVGNCAFLRAKYGSRIAMHREESEAVERGDMLLSRKKRSLLARVIFSFTRLGPSDRFKPDIYLEDESDLGAYGFDARVLHLPGHSRGSIGILTSEGDLFCGDLLANWSRPAVHLVDDEAAANASLEKLRRLNIKTVYPGHGKPFLMEQFWTGRGEKVL